jgi:aryl-alcohol dehydrogenase-like predicted oxidoreductase
MKQKQSRREFIQHSLAGVAGVSLATTRIPAAVPVPPAEPQPLMPYRPLGKTGVKVSLLGVGGFHIGVGSEDEGMRIIQEALDNGVNFLDNAWEYHNGRSEERVGKAIQGRRDKVFVMTKHHGRDKKTALEHLEDSLRRLRTDVIDLWMFHECVYEEDPDRIFAKGGGIEAADLAKQQGKARFIGFTGHKDPMIHLKMLAYEYPWDAVLMPLNILDGTFKSFEKWVLPVLVQRGIAPLAMKTRASGEIVKAGIARPEECWRYVSALPVTTIVSGMQSLDLLRANLKLARTLQPMSSEEKQTILARTREAALTGNHERFKTSRAFDGPVGRKLYGIAG